MSLSLHGPTFRRARQFSEVFVETGTHIGGGILGATLAGFERMYTCDISPDMVAKAKKNMGTVMGRAHYYIGDSTSRLPEMLADAGRPCAVLLDAHCMPGDPEQTALSEDGSVCPLRAELAALAKSPRTHLVMVDDIDLCGTHHLAGITLEEVKFLLTLICPEYRFEIAHGVRRDMLLFALPPGFTQ